MIDLKHPTNSLFYSLVYNAGAAGGNCGLETVSAFRVSQVSGKKNTWGQDLPVEPKAAKKLPLEEVYDMLKANMPAIQKHFLDKKKSIIVISDRVADLYPVYDEKGTAVSSEKNRLDPTNETFKKATEAYSLSMMCTGLFMRAVRETRTGMLISTPIVENPMHHKDSAIMAVLWIPNPALHIIDSRIGFSGKPSALIPDPSRAKLEAIAKKAGDTFYEQS